MPTFQRTEGDGLNWKVAPLPAGACECGRRSTRDILAVGVLIALILSHLGTNYVILREDNTFFQWDRADLHVSTTLFMEYVRESRGFDVVRTISKELYLGTREGDVDPPLIQALGALFFTLFGPDEDVGGMANAPAIVLLYVAVYLLGKRLFNRESGLLAAILLIGFPGLLCLSRVYRPHFLLAGMVTLSILLLVESEHMTNRKKALAFGIVLGLTAMTNMPFSAFLAGPIVVEVLRPLLAALMKGESKKAKSIVVNAVLAAAICFAIAGPWYLVHTANVFRLHGEVRRDTLFDAGRERLDLRAEYLLNVVRVFGAVLFFPHLVAAAAASLFLILVLKKERALLFSWILPAPLCLILLGLGGDIPVLVKDLLPSLPAVALIIASALAAIAGRGADKKKGKPVRTAMTALILVLLILEVSLMLLISFRGSGDILHPLGKPIVDLERHYAVNAYGILSPFRLRFDIGHSAEMLRDELARGNRAPVVFLLNPEGGMTVDLMWVNILPAMQREGREIFTTQCIGHSTFDFVSLVTPADLGDGSVSCVREFLRADYAIVEVPTFNTHPRDDQISEHISSFGPWLHERMANATVLDTLSFESGTALAWYDRYLPGFEWVGGNTWILKLGNKTS